MNQRICPDCSIVVGSGQRADLASKTEADYAWPVGIRLSVLMTVRKGPAMRRGMLVPAATICTALLAFAHPALADAIDGDWCRADGKRMTIRGSAIVTPGGQQTSGDYTRHFFSYVVPAGEAGAGATVSIQLLGEYLAHARQGADPAVQEWRRCQPGVS